MSRAPFFEWLTSVGIAMVLFSVAQGGTRTEVAFAGRDDTLPKLGRPGIAVRVDGPTASDAIALSNEISRELAQQVYTRPLAKDAPYDYDLGVAFDAPRIVGPLSTVVFSAVLTSSRGERLWRIEGRSEVDGAALDSAVFSGIGRNVVSALIHDGWVQPRYDPDDPPPQPPSPRRD